MKPQFQKVRIVFLRHEIKIDFIKDNTVHLTEGPPVGTKIVTQGAAELYGTEYEVVDLLVIFFSEEWIHLFLEAQHQ